jgi:hypothetical protein
MSNESNMSLPIAMPFYGDVEAIEIAPLIESPHHCTNLKKTVYNICTCLLCLIMVFVFLFYLFFIL